jgi:GT2 family glycosyltransferase
MANDPPGYVFQTLLARRRAFDRVGMLNESLILAEDVEWYARAKDMGIGLEVVPEVLVRRYLHGDNMTAQRKTTASEKHEDLLNLIAARVKGMGTQSM